MHLKTGAFVVALAVVLGLVFSYFSWLQFYYHLRHAIGFDSQATMAYAFVSGVGPMLLTALLGGGAILSLIHHVNCHQHGCARIGRFPVGDSGFKVCRHHHPDPRVTEGLQPHHLHAMWKDHQERIAPPPVTIRQEATGNGAA